MVITSRSEAGPMSQSNRLPFMKLHNDEVQYDS